MGVIVSILVFCGFLGLCYWMLVAAAYVIGVCLIPVYAVILAPFYIASKAKEAEADKAEGKATEKVKSKKTVAKDKPERKPLGICRAIADGFRRCKYEDRVKSYSIKRGRGEVTPREDGLHVCNVYLAKLYKDKYK